MANTSQWGLSENNNRCLPVPVIDVQASTIIGGYSVVTPVVYPIILGFLSNFTNQMVDYSFDGGQTTTGHLASGQTISLNMKTNRIPISGQSLLAFRATSTVPTTGFCSLTNFSVN
jgi:hypothetical protein